MTSYENAPSTRLLATYCCACGRPLRDAESVELGIGPICRRNHGYDAMVSAAARAEANTLVHGIAARRRMTVEERNRLIALGFERLAERLTSRLLRRSTRRDPRPIDVHVVSWRGVERLAVSAPYNADALPAWRALGEWDRASKSWMVHRREASVLLDMLEQHYPGHTVIGLERPRKPHAHVETVCPTCDGRGFTSRTGGLCRVCDGEGYSSSAA